MILAKIQLTQSFATALKNLCGMCYKSQYLTEL